MGNIFCNCDELDENDKNYWQMMRKRKRFLDMFWNNVYVNCDMSWNEIFDYINSGDFTIDVCNDIFTWANSKDLDLNNI